MVLPLSFHLTLSSENNSLSSSNNVQALLFSINFINDALYLISSACFADNVFYDKSLIYKSAGVFLVKPLENQGYFAILPRENLSTTF